MKILHKLYILLIIIFFISCVNKKDKLILEIKTLENSVKNQNNNKKDINDLFNTYLIYINDYPEDTSVVVKMLYNASSLSVNLNNPNKAVELLNLLVNKYPNSEITPDAYIYLGFIYETILNDKNRASVFYEEYLNKFPKHELREDIKINLKNINKTPEEIVEEFLKQQN